MHWPNVRVSCDGRHRTPLARRVPRCGHPIRRSSTPTFWRFTHVVVAAAQEGWLRMIGDVLDGVDIERHRETFGNGLIDRFIEASERLKEKAFVTDDTEN